MNTTSNHQAAAIESKIQVRHPNFDYGTDIPIHYFGGHPVSTHLVSGISLLFPAGERYFIRSVNYWVQRLNDPELSKKVKLFFGQEAVHAKEHERFFELLESQGFPVNKFIRLYEFWCFKVLERLEPKILRLSTTAALEHYTAMLAHHMLSTDLLDNMPERIRKLYLWHSAEEIEHKAVAFDVLKRVNPSYTLRVAGLIWGTFKLTFFWIWAAIWLMWHDKSLNFKMLFKGISRVQQKYPLHRMVMDGIKSYLKKDFHPNQVDNYHLAQKFLSTLRS